MDDLFYKVHEKLPIFKFDHGQQSIIYSPGHFITLRKTSLSETKNLFNNPVNISDSKLKEAVSYLINTSKQCISGWKSKINEPFDVDCLTIHVGSECNLDCDYCYTKPDDNKKLKGYPEIEFIEKSLEYIVNKRDDRSRQLTIVYHGSGEPTFYWEKLVDSYDDISSFAKRNNLQLFHYIATNGCLTKQQVIWLAENMNLIGISCDGPPEIHKKQRTKNNENYPAIDEICRLILSRNGQFDIRVTITPDTVEQQPDIVRYLIQDCNAKRIRIEPVYLVQDTFQSEDAEIFYRSFEKARFYGNKRGVTVDYSGVRLEEQHGSYCDVSRNTIRLTPEGLLRNCFCVFDDKEAFITGRYNKEESAFEIRSDVKDLKRRALSFPDECTQCINIFHCSRGCPDFCIFQTDGNQKLNPFRCRLHQIITVEKLKELVDANGFKNE